MGKRKWRKRSFIVNIFSILFLTILVCSFLDITDVRANSECKVGDIIGIFQQSDTKVNISVSGNNFKLEYRYIPTYTVNNELCIVAEDLAYYGYTFSWDPENRITRLYLDDGKKNTKGTTKFVKKEGKIYYTDIKVYVDNEEIPAYNMGGYSLVKLSDLSSKVDSITFNKIFPNNKSMSISGKIELPNNEKAPKGGLKVTPIFYFFNIGTLEEYPGDEYVILEGKSSVDYKIELPMHKYQNKMGYEYPGVYNYTGYKIKNPPKDYIVYDMQGSIDPNNIYLEKLNYYQDTYNNINIKILPKQTVNLKLKLNGDVFGLYGDEDTREVEVYAIDSENNKHIYKFQTVSCNQHSVQFQFDLIKNRKYKYLYNIAIMGPLHRKMGPSQFYPTLYYNNGIGQIDENSAEAVEANEEKNVINTSIKLPNIIVGDLYKADKKVMYNSTELEGYMANENYFVKDFFHSVESIDKGTYNSNISVDSLLKNNTEKSLGKLIVLYFGGYDLPSYCLKNITYDEFIKIDDLKKEEFNVNYKEDVIEITRSNIVN